MRLASNNYYIGLMSGTSVDAIDSVIVEFADADINLIASHSHPIPDLIRAEVKALTVLTSNELQRLLTLDVQLGHLFADASLALLSNAGIPATAISAIGSHGQTIRHLPNANQATTLQIADANIIAARCQITTVADFRRRDIAYGGQGAPLVPGFFQAMMAAHAPIAFLNLGGIASLCLLETNSVRGFDTGPANTLLDAWCQQTWQLDCDHGGERAARGQIIPALVNTMLDDAYFQQPIPKTTGPDYFNLTWLARFNLNQYQADSHDVLASLVEVSVQSIKAGLPTSLPSLYVSGGGVHNHYFMQRLAKAIAPTALKTTELLELPSDWLEAMAFAWYAKQCLQGRATDLRQVTGASQPNILGTIYPA